MGEPRRSERDVILDITGMSCASCVDRIEGILRREPSVSEVRVSLATRTAAIRTRSQDVAPLIAAVHEAGYGARPHEPRRPVAEERRDLYRRSVVSVFCSAYVLLFSLVVSPGSRGSVLLAWAFATPVQFYSAWPFLRGAARALRGKTYTMDVLVACGSLAAYGYSAVSTLSGGHHAYFDTAAMIVTLILLGRMLESMARSRAGDAVQTLLERQPRNAVRLEGDVERSVALEDLSVGDLVVVRPGQQVPADGVVRSGRSSVDASMLTGESALVGVGPGGDVVGGSLNVEGLLVVELIRVGADTRFAEIVRLLESTQASKAPIQRLADRVAAALVPRLLVLAGVVFFFEAVISAKGPAEATLRAAAVLLVACPCSLGLATPVAIMAGSGRAAELGILFKGGEVFEAARRIDTILIDKTGTLTDGAMILEEIVAIGVSEDELLGVAAAVEHGSEHAIARCVVRAAQQRRVEVPNAVDHRADPGVGITAVVDRHRVRVGRPEGLPIGLRERVEQLAARGLVVFAVWRDEEAIGLVGAVDAVKVGAVEAVERLRGFGFDVAIVSGDRRAATEAVARALAIDRVVAEAFPGDKVAEVERLQALGRRVAFVGDGVNDAPALARADIGIALGTGTDVAIEAGQVLVMGGDLALIGDSFEVARKTFWVIAQNLAWAFAYNGLMIPLAIMGKVSPLVAAAAMAGSSVTVVGNALRLGRFGWLHRSSPVPRSVPIPQIRVPSAESRYIAPDEPRVVPSSPELAGDEHPSLSGFAKDELVRIIGVLDRQWSKQWEF